MSAEQWVVWTLACDSCGEKLADPECDNELVAESVESIRGIAVSHGWSRDDDLCPTCTCARIGHDRRVSRNGTYAYCDRCSETLLEAITAEPKAAYL